MKLVAWLLKLVAIIPAAIMDAIIDTINDLGYGCLTIIIVLFLFAIYLAVFPFYFILFILIDLIYSDGIRGLKPLEYYMTLGGKNKKQ